MRETYLNIGSLMLLFSTLDRRGSRSRIRDAPGWLSLSLFSRKSSDDELLFMSLCLVLACPCICCPQVRSRPNGRGLFMLHALQSRHCFVARETAQGILDSVGLSGCTAYRTFLDMSLGP